MVIQRTITLVPSLDKVTLTLVPGDLKRSFFPAGDIATCGTCGRSWDDGQSTGTTPTPGGRCPFEYNHDEEEGT